MEESSRNRILSFQSFMRQAAPINPDGTMRSLPSSASDAAQLDQKRASSTASSIYSSHSLSNSYRQPKIAVDGRRASSAALQIALADMPLPMLEARSFNSSELTTQKHSSDSIEKHKSVDSLSDYLEMSSPILHFLPLSPALALPYSDIKSKRDVPSPVSRGRSPGPRSLRGRRSSSALPLKTSQSGAASRTPRKRGRRRRRSGEEFAMRHSSRSNSPFHGPQRTRERPAAHTMFPKVPSLHQNHSLDPDLLLDLQDLSDSSESSNSDADEDEFISEDEQRDLLATIYPDVSSSNVATEYHQILTNRYRHEQTEYQHELEHAQLLASERPDISQVDRTVRRPSTDISNLIHAGFLGRSGRPHQRMVSGVSEILSLRTTQRQLRPVPSAAQRVRAALPIQLPSVGRRGRQALRQGRKDRTKRQGAGAPVNRDLTSQIRLNRNGSSPSDRFAAVFRKPFVAASGIASIGGNDNGNSYSRAKEQHTDLDHAQLGPMPTIPPRPQVLQTRRGQAEQQDRRAPLSSSSSALARSVIDSVRNLRLHDHGGSGEGDGDDDERAQQRRRDSLKRKIQLVGAIDPFSVVVDKVAH